MSIVLSLSSNVQVVYAKFPEDIARRRVLLMYPIMSTGNTIIKATKVLLEHGVQPENIILLNLFCTPKGKCQLALKVSQGKYVHKALGP